MGSNPAASTNLRRGGRAVVADQPAREADQDRRQGRQPRPLRRLPIGRGLGVASDVCGNLVADWAVARPARASVSGGEVIRDERRRQRSALMRAERRVPAPRRSHPAVSTASCGRGARLPLPKTPERAILRPTSGECRLKVLSLASGERDVRSRLSNNVV